MQRFDTRKITLSGLTLVPEEGSPFTSTLELNNVPLAPDMEAWYTSFYVYGRNLDDWALSLNKKKKLDKISKKEIQDEIENF